jgi:6-pyruvoyltetrahydropterin/6-carboxytetrahydropterin synthase
MVAVGNGGRKLGKWPRGQELHVYEVRVNVRFDAAHQVRMYDGELEPLHSHDWRAEAVFRGPDLDGIEVLVDFVAVKQALDSAIEPLMGRRLNDVEVLGSHNPTAEIVARYVFDDLRRRLGPEVPLVAVNIEEAPGCIAGYEI